MNSLDGLSYVSNNLSGLHVGNFDNINSVTYQTEIPNQNILYLQGLTGNVQQQIDNAAGGGSSIPSITYDSGLNLTSFTGGMSFPSQSISSASINNSDFVTNTTNQSNLTGIKTWSGTQIFSSIQLNDNLIVNSGGTTILNSNLALINFLSGTATNINTRFTTNESNISTVQTKTTGLTYSSAVTTTTCAGRFIFNATPTCAQSLRLDGSLLLGTGGNITITNAQLQLIPNISTLNTKTTNISFASNITTISNTTNLTDINFSGNINTFTKAQFDNAINFSKSATSDLQTQISSINTNLSGYALQSALQAVLDDKIGTMIYYEPTDFNIFKNLASLGEIQYTDANNTKINIVPIITSSQDKLLKISRNSQYDFFDISSNCHIYGKLQLGNYPDVEYSLNAVIIAEGVTAGATGLNTAALLTMTTTTIPGINLRLTGLEVDVADLETAAALLENKTQKISYSNFDNTTTISAITSIYNLKVGNLESGLIQTENLNVRFIGVTEIRNDFIIANGFGADIDGGINQLYANAVSTFAGALTVNNNFTSGGTNTNINSDNCTITGLTTIKLNTTNPILNVVLPSTVGAFNAQGILIGKEQTNGQSRNCNIGYNYYQDGHANNYGYLGLNVMAGAGNLIESFRWFDGGCSIPVGNLTITEGDLTVTAGSVSIPTGNMTLAAGNVNLTNGDLSIISGDAFLTSGTLSLTNGNCNLTNGDINLVSGELKTNTISNQSGSALDLNANNINIGTNQGILGLNTVYIGNALSGTIIYLNGAVSSPYAFNVTGAFSQWT